MTVGIFRGGCLTGPSHSGVELHGFLSYLVKVALSVGTYTYSGTRENGFVTTFTATMWCAPSKRSRPTSSGKKFNWKYVDENRSGDYIYCISNLAKFHTHYLNWSVTMGPG
jgi:CDP-paratose 2-epimerase